MRIEATKASAATQVSISAPCIQASDVPTTTGIAAIHKVFGRMATAHARRDPGGISSLLCAAELAGIGTRVAGNGCDYTTHPCRTRRRMQPPGCARKRYADALTSRPPVP